MADPSVLWQPRLSDDEDEATRWRDHDGIHAHGRLPLDRRGTTSGSNGEPGEDPRPLSGTTTAQRQRWQDD